MHSTTFFVLAIIAMVAQGYLLLLFFFEPGLRYKLSTRAVGAVESREFVHALEALTDSKLRPAAALEVLTNGEHFYQNELECIARARTSINLEAYIFQRGRVAHDFVNALGERARAGVKVNLLLDAVGSAGMFRGQLRGLTEAGGKFAWYHPLGWHTIPSFNNRTHRELLIVDGKVAFAGGAGIADHWLYPRKRLWRDNAERWRDTMVRFEGDAVTALQATFAENWLEAHGELLSGADYFPMMEARPSCADVLVVASTPTAGGATRAHVLFQLLIASAQRSIHITTPYFLPDKSARSGLMRAARERGVDVRLLLPGRHSDHFQTRSSSRRFYGDLLRAGARIFEYKPAMVHAKIMIVDGLWSVVGSTNFDSRSFRLNDEANAAIRDEGIAARLAEDFAADLAQSREMSFEAWKHRNPLARLDEAVGMVFERLE